jgi:predicted ATPase
VATNIDEMDRDPNGIGAPIIMNYGGVSLHKQSHGESFLALVENRFGGNGLYILDEPEAALSPRGIIRLMQKMDELKERNSQFIISTHSPMLLCFPDAEVYQITRNGIDSVRFQDTDHYRTTVRFLQNPESAVAEALGYGAEE